MIKAASVFNGGSLLMYKNGNLVMDNIVIMALCLIAIMAYNENASISNIC